MKKINAAASARASVVGQRSPRRPWTRPDLAILARVRRRSVLGSLITTPALACTHAATPAAALLAPSVRPQGTPDQVARDEAFWAEIQRAFPVDRGMINFNNGGVSPSPAIVQESLARSLAFANEAPAYKMWQLIEPRKELVRTQLARHFGIPHVLCAAEDAWSWRRLPALLAESAIVFVGAVGTRWARLIRSERLLARVS